MAICVAIDVKKRPNTNKKTLKRNNVTKIKNVCKRNKKVTFS